MSEEILENPVTGEVMRILESTEHAFRAEYSLRAHGEIAGAHLQPNKEQSITVLAGEMHMRVNGEHCIVRAGETMTLPVGARHFEWNPCDVEALVVEEIRPAGGMHDFFKVLFGLARDGRTDRQGFPPPLLAAALFSQYSDSFQLASPAARLLVRVVGPIALPLYRREFEKYLH